jgi:hypothetical protein
MNYAVKYKNSIVLGIIPWNNKYIMDVFRTRYFIDIELPSQEPTIENFPYQVNSDIIIYPAEEQRSGDINPLVEYYLGPTWELSESILIAKYEILPLPLNDAKNNYRDLASKIRYDREISGITINIANNEYKIETNRDERIKYIEKLSSMEDNSIVNWKFSEGWASLTKNDFMTIVTSISAHVQNAFDYELELTNAINNSSSIEQLLSIEDLNIQVNI